MPPSGKQLIILRHAQSSWELPPGTQDVDRPLTAKGVNEAHSAGLQIAARGWIPDHALVSPATRTRMTWQYCHEAFPAAQIPTQYIPELYQGSKQSLLSSARAHGGDAQRLVVVSHWPGVKDATDFLTGGNVQMGTAYASLMRYKGHANDTWDDSLQRKHDWALVDVVAPFRGAGSGLAVPADAPCVSEDCIEALDDEPEGEP